MKKIIVFALSVLLISPVSFSQSGKKMNVNADNQEINIRFENKKKKGYYNTTQIGLLMGNRQVTRQAYYYPWYYPGVDYYSNYMPQYRNYSDTNTELQISPSVTMTNGYMFNEHWAAGIGVGFEIFDRNLFPAFADIRYVLWDNKISPYFAVKAGYAFGDFKEKHYDNLTLNYEPYNAYNADFRCYGGLMLNPEMGVKIPLSGNADLLFTVAYRQQKIKSTVKQDYGNGQFDKWEHKESLNRLSFGVAIMFR